MRKVCAWCGKELSNISQHDRPISHGICERCADYLKCQKIKISDFIEKFNFPILVMDDKGRAEAANSNAREILKEEPVGRLGGEVIQCKYSFDSGGCGKTKYCSGCTIRNAVMDSMLTNKGHNEVAEQPIQTPSGIRTFNISFTTEKVGELVMLKLGKMEQQDE